MDDELGRTLLALSLHDEHTIDAFVGRDDPSAVEPVRQTRTSLVAQVAALLCLDAETSTFQVFVERALAAGVEPDELLAVLIAVAPLIGAPRVVSGAASLARALGYDLDGALELHDHDTGRERMSSSPDDVPVRTWS